MSRFTILGSSGYIGRHLCAALRARGEEVQACGRGDVPQHGDLGHVIDCVAVTNDARSRPAETVRANVSHLIELLENARFESLLYLSTAQMYFGAPRAHEDEPVRVSPSDPSDLYRASKLLGESLCWAMGGATVRVARLAAVYGDEAAPRSFLAEVVRAATTARHVVLQTSLASTRDFVHVDDVARILPEISLRGRHRVYNVASGVLTDNATIMAALTRDLGCTYEVAASAPTVGYPTIDVSRMRDDLGLAASVPLDASLRALTRGIDGGAR